MFGLRDCKLCVLDLISGWHSCAGPVEAASEPRSQSITGSKDTIGHDQTETNRFIYIY